MTSNIRRALLTFVLSLACFSAANAQIGDLKNIFSIGVNGGINMSKASFSPSIKQKNLNGMTGGLSLRYISEKYFGMTCGVMLEINYTQRGWSETSEDYPDLKYQRTVNYVEMPFLAHLAFGKKAVQFFVHAGPQIGLYLSDSQSKSGDWENSSLDTTQHFKDINKKFDYGIAGGGGLELNTKAGHFLLEGRYYYALSDFFGNDKKEFFSRSAHNGIAVKLTYLFDITK